MTEPHDTSGPDPGPPGPTAGGPPPPATPRWVKVTGLVLALLALVVLARVLFGGGVGGHGPDLHGGLDSPAAVPAGVALAR